MPAQLDEVSEGSRGLRDRINQRPGLMIAIAAAIGLLFLGVGIYSAISAPTRQRTRAKPGQFYSESRRM